MAFVAGALGVAACSRPSAADVAKEVPTVAVVKAAIGDVSQVLTLGAVW